MEMKKATYLALSGQSPVIVASRRLVGTCSCSSCTSADAAFVGTFEMFDPTSIRDVFLLLST